MVFGTPVEGNKMRRTPSSLLALKLREFLDTPGAAQAAGGAPHLTSEPHQLGSARAPLPPLAEWPRPSARLNPSGPPVNSVWVDAFFYGFWIDKSKVADFQRDYELLRMAQRDAAEWIERDPDLSSDEHALLRRRLLKRFREAVGLVDVG